VRVLSSDVYRPSFRTNSGGSCYWSLPESSVRENFPPIDQVRPLIIVLAIIVHHVAVDISRVRGRLCLR